MNIRLIIFIGILALQSCNHNLPIAKIRFVRIDRENSLKGYYFLVFDSDIELKEMLSKDFTGERLSCFFLKRNDNKLIEDQIINGGGLELTSVGCFEAISNKGYRYKVNVTFRNQENNVSAGRMRNQDIEELKRLFNTYDCISCVVNAVTFMDITNRYISETMCVPTKSFL